MLPVLINRYCCRYCCCWFGACLVPKAFGPGHFMILTSPQPGGAPITRRVLTPDGGICTDSRKMSGLFNAILNDSRTHVVDLRRRRGGKILIEHAFHLLFPT